MNFVKEDKTNTKRPTEEDKLKEDKKTPMRTNLRGRTSHNNARWRTEELIRTRGRPRTRWVDYVREGGREKTQTMNRTKQDKLTDGKS